jgi:hypothetical protein
MIFKIVLAMATILSSSDTAPLSSVIFYYSDPSADKSTDIRNNMFTADKNLMQARIADKSLKLQKSIPVFLLFR